MEQGGEHPRLCAEVCGLLLAQLRLGPLHLPVTPARSPESALPGSASTELWETLRPETQSGVVAWGDPGSAISAIATFQALI